MVQKCSRASASSALIAAVGLDVSNGSQCLTETLFPFEIVQTEHNKESG